ncbi:MAG: hypothetical protein E7487_02085 [Ruminococcaceae bacterium]|nr:hypothetical protein [Oscillospiraceae bacterium]
MKILYNEFKSRKMAGEKLSFETLTDEQLFQLYVKENTIAPMIADLFDISIRQFSERRRCLGTTLRELAMTVEKERLSRAS